MGTRVAVEGNETGVERADAAELLLAHRIAVGKVHRVFTAGDLGAECDGRGVPRLTILYESLAGPEPEAWTAIQLADGALERWPGWGARPVDESAGV